MWETWVQSWVGKIPWRRKWQFTPVLLPGKSHGQRSLVDYSPWDRKESDTTERLHFSSSWSLSHVWIFVIPWTAACQAPLFFTLSWSLLKFISTELVMLYNHLILCCPLLLLPSIFPSIRDFSNESALHIRWPEYWSFSINPSNQNSGLISFKIDWFDLLAVQETFRSLLQHHSLKASILWCSAFFIVQLTTVHDHWENHSLDYIDLCRQSSVWFSTHRPGLPQLSCTWLQNNVSLLEKLHRVVLLCFLCISQKCI